MADDDLICIRRCREGDVEAFGDLVEKYQKPVFNAVFRVVHDYEDAREITQQVFMKIFENLSRFDPERRFFSWLYRVAVNEAINFVSSKKPTESLERDVPHEALDPEAAYQNREAGRDVRRAIADLTLDYRVVVVLRHFLQLSYREMGDVLNIPEKTVKSRLFTARQQLRSALEAMGYREN